MKMKKNKNRIVAGIVIGFLILMSSIPAMAEGITLLTPNTLPASVMTPIRWSYNGSFEPNVNIELLKDGTLIGTIASETYIGDIIYYNEGIPYGEGNYHYWNISISLAPGMYQLKITGHNTSGLEVTNTKDIEVTAVTTEICKSCHPIIDATDRHHYLVSNLVINPITNTTFSCADCHPMEGTYPNKTMLIDRNCLNCHNGTAFWANPLVINPGQPHLNTVPPPDNTPPVINSVTLSDNTPNTGDPILVTVNATDDALITSITANDVSLTKQSDNIWTGSIIAIEGTHSINISAHDVAGQVTWDNSTSYTSPDTPPVINSVTLSTNTPNTGDNILVTVNATDDVSVTSVVANGVSLTKQSNDIWTGSITAIEGTHSVNVSASDNADQVTWDNSTSYTAITPNIIVTSPMTGDNWVRGTTQTIRWTYTGNLGNYAKIELLEQGRIDETWDNVPQSNGAGSYDWAIPSNFEASTYQIKVSAGDYSNTTGNFKIVKR